MTYQILQTTPMGTGTIFALTARDALAKLGEIQQRGYKVGTIRDMDARAIVEPSQLNHRAAQEAAIERGEASAAD